MSCLVYLIQQNGPAQQQKQQILCSEPVDKPNTGPCIALVITLPITQLGTCSSLVAENRALT
jgi:hypothetical protein